MGNLNFQQKKALIQGVSVEKERLKDMNEQFFYEVKSWMIFLEVMMKC